MCRQLVLLSLIAVFPADAWASSSDALARVGNWEIEYNQNACHLRAQFGEALNPVVLRISRNGASDSFEMAITDARLRVPDGLADARITFVPQNVSFTREVSRVDVQGSQALVMRAVRLDGKSWDAKERADPAIASGINRIDIAITGMETIRLNTGPLASPFRALSACTADLLRTWGFDPAAAERLAILPEPSTFAGNWATSLDYPPAALRSRLEGVTRFRVDIEATGKPRRCTVTGSSGSPDLDVRACQLMMARSRFHSARSTDGTPIAWYWMSSVRWSLPQ